MLAVPVAVAVAVLKYRLYDIDRVISRTLGYAIVTGLLVGVYAGLVLLATQVLGLHTPVAVAAATLAAAALFSPIRLRVQRMVDRRFNRARYDAEATVAAFAARLKDAVDLDTVRDDLASMVQTGTGTRPPPGLDQPARLSGPRVAGCRLRAGRTGSTTSPTSARNWTCPPRCCGRTATWHGSATTSKRSLWCLNSSTGYADPSLAWEITPVRSAVPSLSPPGAALTPPGSCAYVSA